MAGFWSGLAWELDLRRLAGVILAVGISVFFGCALAAAVGMGEEPAGRVSDKGKARQ